MKKSTSIDRRIYEEGFLLYYYQVEERGSRKKMKKKI
jgi:hypothetical protein